MESHCLVRIPRVSTCADEHHFNIMKQIHLKGGKMTTQVVLMNGLGVALASDSAVTAGGKVLNTSEKIFELPPPHKAAILTSGRARFMGMPWEVLLSAWSESLHKPLTSMTEYIESRYAFLRATIPNNGNMSVSEIEYLEATLFGPNSVHNAYFEAMKRHVLPYYESILPVEDREIFMTSAWDPEFKLRMNALLTDDIIEAVLASLDEADAARREYVACPDVSEAQARIWVEKYWSTRPAGYEFEAFEDGWPDIPGLKTRIVNLHSVFIVHADYNGESNVNIVGYGSGDLFPAWEGTFLHGCVRGTLLKRFEERFEPSNGPRDLFFGQVDAISALTGRGDDLLVNAAVESSKKQLTAIFETLSEIEDERALKTKQYIEESLNADDIRQKMLTEGREQRRNPFRKAISMSPVLDLAEFAAQLVGVQSAYAAMTQDNPSVGGFVDVGFITHRRGFEWVRHKH
jgi:hypothetical protein